jgi:3'-5' exoribonuclease
MDTSENTPPAETPAPPATAERVEKVRKIYARDLKEKERVNTVFRVAKKARQVSRQGKPFLVVQLGDRTGDIDARVFDGVDERDAQFAVGDYVLVEGHVITHQGKPQIVLENVEKLDPEPIDPKEFQSNGVSGVSGASSVSGEANRTVAQIREAVERVHDGNVRQLLLAFLDDPDIARGLPVAPAAKGIHHAYKGGLADHILSVIRLAHRIADHYPMADRDLLVAGALLHDISKVRELSYDRAFDYTDEGRLVGHLVMTAQAIREKSRAIPGFPPLLEQHLTHLVLAHHGQLEFGSPKLPVTLEAMLVHLIDTMDSRVASWLELMARDSNETWTDVSRLYDRHLWKGPLPTSRGRAPVDAKPKRHRENERRSRNNSNAKDSQAAAPPAPKSDAPPKDFAFPPLAALAGTEGPKPT